jgi:hypothetical protein
MGDTYYRPRDLIAKIVDHVEEVPGVVVPVCLILISFLASSNFNLSCILIWKIWKRRGRERYFDRPGYTH